MISALVLVLSLLQAAFASTSDAASAAECEAWLCLPAGFSVSECSPAKTAVDRRLQLNMDPLPPWSECAQLYDAHQAPLTFTNTFHRPCGQRIGRGTVTVLLSGQNIPYGQPYSYQRPGPIVPCPPPPPDPDPNPNDPNLGDDNGNDSNNGNNGNNGNGSTDPDPYLGNDGNGGNGGNGNGGNDGGNGNGNGNGNDCPNPPCNDNGNGCPNPPCDPEDDCPNPPCNGNGNGCPVILCPIGYIQHSDCVCRPAEIDDDTPFTPPVGPPVPACNTIACPHVQHGWGAAPLTIDWTLRPGPPVPH